MDKNLKHALQAGFEPPPPKRKEDFLKKLNAPKSTYLDFFLAQIGYIRKRVWCLSAGITMIVIALLLSNGQKNNWNGYDTLLWIASALIPFLALLTVTEVSRSASFGMAELELSCRYNLSQIVMARAAILGISNFLCLLILVLAAAEQTTVQLLFVSLYIFVPYLLTCAVSIFAINRIGGNDSLYCCAAISCGVSLGGSMMRAVGQILFTPQYLWAWGALGFFSLLLLTVQIKNFMRTTEEFQWNLLSTD